MELQLSGMVVAWARQSVSESLCERPGWSLTPRPHPPPLLPSCSPLFLRCQYAGVQGCPPPVLHPPLQMYLHGQGCEKNVPMAQEWLRKAR